MKNPVTRRHFLGAALGAAGASLGAEGFPSSVAFTKPSASPIAVTRPSASLALLGGDPVRKKSFPSWPKILDNDEQSWMEVLRRGKWCRLDGNYAKRFEETWAKALGAKYCLATSCGTSALLTSLNALGVGPRDEVLVPPYTFVATIDVVLMQHALPVFVDTDPETFQMDASKIEAAITERTKCILPVHLGGSPANLDQILAIGRKHRLPVLEDACQAHFAEWRHRKVSTWGELGCFSFQASKNLNSGEGGAILSNDESLIRACESFHNNGRGEAGAGFTYIRTGLNHRITEFQAALLLSQFSRLEEQSRLRTDNAAYLTTLLREIPGIEPARMYEGCTRNAYHLYMFRYDKTRFAGAPRARFLKALEAEGIPCSGGYAPLNKEPFLENTFNTRAFRSFYSPEELAGWEQRNRCPANDRLCEEAVWFFQTMFLGPKSDMDQIAEAVRKVQQQADRL